MAANEFHVDSDNNVRLGEHGPILDHGRNGFGVTTAHILANERQQNLDKAVSTAPMDEAALRRAYDPS